MKVETPTVKALIETTDDQHRAQIHAALIALPDTQRPRSRKQLIGSLTKSAGPESAKTRGWLVNTLAKVIDDDKDAYATVIQTVFHRERETRSRRATIFLVNTG